MKDGLHLLGGAVGATLALALYIFGIGAFQRCHGAEVADNPPPVPKPDYIPLSGERVLIGDMEYVMVSAGDWKRLMGAVARLEAVAKRRWTKEHQTEEGRRAWHGAATNRVVSADGRSVTWHYRDGYVHTEQVEPSRRVSPAVKRTQGGVPRPKIAGGTRLPPRLEAKRKALEARPAAKEVSATFGAGGKVLKVEGAK